MFCVVARTVQLFCLTECPRGRSKILVFPSATKRNQLRSVHFDRLLLEAILKVCFFGAHFLRILVFLFWKRTRTLVISAHRVSIHSPTYRRCFLGAQCRTFCSVLGSLSLKGGLHVKKTFIA